ncbi:MAG: murein biosynthesis integral membrane protein MurJ, partial [Verrucomicrobiota bacterium]|nr:murein biosynthesis integral membrane protein MurJ [Verrucomicrobiota bacterium]
MLKSSGAMAAAVVFSRVLGFVREAVYAAFMGDGLVAAAFKLAFLIPNLFRRLLGEGALSAAFIPIFKAKEKTAGENEMWKAANAVISGLTVAASALIALVVLGISLVFAGDLFLQQHDRSGILNDQTWLMLQLLRIMFPYLLLVCLAAIFIGMLNARGYFFIPAMGTSLLNLVMISSVFLSIFLGRSQMEQIFGVAIGVLLGGTAQAIYQWFHLKKEG